MLNYRLRPLPELSDGQKTFSSQGSEESGPVPGEEKRLRAPTTSVFMKSLHLVVWLLLSSATCDTSKIGTLKMVSKR